MSKLTKIFVIFMFFTSFSYSKNIDDIRKLVLDLEKKYSIYFYFEYLPKTSWKIGHDLAKDENYEDLYKYMKLFDEEFSKYPASFIKKSGIKSVAFASGLLVGPSLQEVSAIPDYYKEVLILDYLRGNYNDIYQRHVIHHEYYHMIEEEFNRNAYWKDPEWIKLNDNDTQYGLGGRYVQKKSNMWEMSHPKKGFINLYSLSAIKEDKAEIFAALFIESEFEKIKRWMQNDSILTKKIIYMKQFLNTVDNGFNKVYWINIYK